jgi:hypothetical protein
MTQHRTYVGLALLFLAGPFACSNPVAVSAGRVSVQALAPNVRVMNQTPLPIYTLTIERSAAAYTEWAPCTEPTSCAAIQPGSATTIPYRQIVGYTSGSREAIVYWWHLRPQGGGFEVDSIRSVVVAL